MTALGMDIAVTMRNALAARIGQDRFELWFGADVVLNVNDERLEVTAADDFQLEQVRRRFSRELESVVREVLGRPLEVCFCVAAPQTVAEAPRESRNPLVASRPALRAVRASESAPADRRRQSAAVRTTAPAEATSSLLPFIVGDENRVAYTSAEMILEHPGRTTPLFIYGPTGCGKTHLLETIRQEARRRRCVRRVVYVSAEQFTTQFLDALHGSGLPNFRRKYRDVELLLIDDLHFFVGKRTTLTELQNTIDSFLRDRRQLVLAADRSPGELTGIHPELRGRMSGGLVCQLDYPSATTRRSIVAHVAERHGGLPDDVLDLLAGRLSGDARQLHGAVHRLTAYRQAHDAPITLDVAETALADLFQAARPVVRLSDIEEAVCDVFGIERETLHSERKEKAISQPRMLAMWLARKHTRAGLSEICRYFGRRSHSTVVSAAKNVNRWVSHKAPVRLAHGECAVDDAIRRIESKLRTG